MRHPTLPPLPTQCLCPALLCLAALLCAPSAWAVLGQPLPASPVRSALSSVPGTPQSSLAPSSLYTTRVTQQDTGTVVTEYATSGGIVFAISWQGPVLPPLETLLGTYFSSFQVNADASRAHRSLGTPMQIRTDTLVVYSRGRMRDFSGHAYDPQLVPSGLQIDALLP